MPKNQETKKSNHEKNNSKEYEAEKARIQSKLKNPECDAIENVYFEKYLAGGLVRKKFAPIAYTKK